MSNAAVIDAFHLMWGNFPEPVCLIHKNREILAVNEASRQMGRLPGTKCNEFGTPEQHRGCLANQALATQKSTYRKAKAGDKDIYAYWLTVPEHPDIYIHFGVGITVDYDQPLEGC
jgi:hypothetical protein